jgi:hypothetical protein
MKCVSMVLELLMLIAMATVIVFRFRLNRTDPGFVGVAPPPVHPGAFWSR